MSDHVTNNDEPYLLVEEVAKRLGLPLSVLLRRVEAGDVPSKRVERDDGTHYALRLSDLGIDTDDLTSAVGGDEDDEADPISLFDTSSSGAREREGLDIADVAAWLREADDLAAPQQEVAGQRELDSAARATEPSGSSPGWAERVPADVASPSEEAQPAWEDPEDAWRSGHTWPPQQPGSPPPSSRPLEPQQPPAWIIPQAPAESVVGPALAQPRPRSLFDTPGTDAAGDRESQAEPAEAHTAARSTSEQPSAEQATEESPADEAPAAQPGAPRPPEDERQHAPAAHAGPHDDAQSTADHQAVVPELAMPDRRRDPARGLFDAAAGTSRNDLSSMSLDARDLVAGLLDRWERTLEQRIYTEQRQRFQGELMARQNMVKQLQMELQTARAEHAAAQAEKDRALAEKERELAERERDLAHSRRLADDQGRPVAPVAAAALRRRRWFRARGDD
ncbi:MAG: hypothetical protein JF887_01110 [Candidatus Dormibacteraeota bacterium]|uniref:Uncharacterized protein n=1 Tax=Candidatus Amunia macphersoniae TaxID=3127014 RepID=A0A934NDS9_9BACT|nr:hypothetical protein [Candidatus Dormibacteraeota bacterium]